MGCSLQQLMTEVSTAYGPSWLSYDTVRRWKKNFESGRPKSASGKEIVSKIKDIIEGDGRFTLHDIARKIIYPLKELDRRGTFININDALIQEYLEKPDLTNKCERLGGLDAQVNGIGKFLLQDMILRMLAFLGYEMYHELSPGEMQRLSFVRLFYHKPKFAVLDESTSQIGIDAEQTMYSMCGALGITVLSVGHRDTLKQYHDLELHFSDSGECSIKPMMYNKDIMVLLKLDGWKSRLNESNKYKIFFGKC